MSELREVRQMVRRYLSVFLIVLLPALAAAACGDDAANISVVGDMFAGKGNSAPAPCIDDA